MKICNKLNGEFKRKCSRGSRILGNSSQEGRKVHAVESGYQNVCWALSIHHDAQGNLWMHMQHPIRHSCWDPVHMHRLVMLRREADWLQCLRESGQVEERQEVGGWSCTIQRNHTHPGNDRIKGFIIVAIQYHLQQSSPGTLLTSLHTHILPPRIVIQLRQCHQWRWRVSWGEGRWCSTSFITLMLL